tara:strand:- start:27584 stop:28171 length:588 start_codon:yes stop_codon:yes gene_type:complete
MAIPIGTKFHGVAPDVETENLGSKQANAQRNVYTFPADFSLPLAFAGTMVNVGGKTTNVGPLGGDSADFGAEKNAASDHIGFVIATFDMEVVSVGWQWASTVAIGTAAGNPAKTLTFKLSVADLGQNMVDASVWTDYSLSTTVDTSGPSYPGFTEDVSTSIKVNKGQAIAFTAVPSSQFANAFEEANVVLTMKKV